jgi:serine/threonine protein kinase
VIDYGKTLYPFYIMRYYERGTLKDLYKDGLSKETILKILFQLLLGFRELYKLEFVYRDLKEENILINDNLTLIFSDLDFIKSENNNILKTFYSTALYTAPEI